MNSKRIKLFISASILLLISCNTNESGSPATFSKDTGKVTRSKVAVEKKQTRRDTLSPTKSYSNKRFKNVIAESIGSDSFLIQGKGQIFEASFNWVVEDGHEELQKGFSMTAAGAPEWGTFKFIVHAPKKKSNSTRTLILYESSAKDGSRQHELPIVLY